MNSGKALVGLEAWQGGALRRADALHYRGVARVVLAAVVAVGVAGCGPDVSPSGEPTDAVSARLHAGQVVLWAEAPDGTKLWATIGQSGRTVYFSSAGTQTHRTENCGKNCTRTVDDFVPAGRSP
jgi:hypothetical protein